ncbi:MAG TPA: ATP-binding protein, partial [Candidatus Aenigmarchaeota archaeon]|nr:ATP-binding protein [Candidatus Aenigmarchaeota archaeon]
RDRELLHEPGDQSGCSIELGVCGNTIGEILDNYLSAKKEWNIKNSFIFLDEITFVDEWWRIIKFRIDKGLFRNDVLTITSSCSLELLKQKEYFPGRRGKGKDIYFFPLDFSTYVEIFGNVELKKIPINKIKKVEFPMKINSLYKNRINKLFNSYLKTGGFPIPIKEFFTQGKVSVYAKKVYLDWLKSDWRKVGKSDKYMKEVISYILRSRLSPISWLSISKDTSLASPHTAQSYIESLEDLFVAKVLNIITPESRVLYRKNKKIHLTDPFLYNTLAYFSGEKVLEETIVESVVASHLSRVADVYFWKNKSEVDIVTKIDKEQVGIEVKWGFKKSRKPKHLRLLSLTKDKLPLFLGSIDWSRN